MLYSQLDQFHNDLSFLSLLGKLDGMGPGAVSAGEREAMQSFDIVSKLTGDNLVRH